MPTVAWFYGVAICRTIRHRIFHVYYSDAAARFRIDDGGIIDGTVPRRVERLVRLWARTRRAELERNWRRMEDGEPLERIAGPDEHDSTRS